MKDFRQRRKRKAEEMGKPPGIRWSYVVDGRIIKQSRQRGQKTGDKGWHSVKRTTTIGDIGFADDTAIVGFIQEAISAETVLTQTMEDWEEKVNKGKTERLRISCAGRANNDVRMEYEVDKVKHLGGILSESASTDPDTSRRVQRGYEIARKVAKAWGLGSKRGRGHGSGLSITTRLDVMQSCVMSAMTAGCRSRAWNIY